MSATFSQIWQEVQNYLDQGISVIPVRDKPQTFNGREYPVKSAYPWAKYNREIISKGELHYQMADKYDTLGYGIVAGKVSGNLEIIDIDVKNWAGIDARLFQDIKSLYPHLYPLLRIHRSPSGGYHILYRIADHEPEGNRKLAFREDTKEAAIETRGTGGYVVASTAMGYSIVQNVPIPTISWTERCSLIAICEGYNERRKVIPLAISKAQSDYYDENPWDMFNASPAAEQVLIDAGWTLAGSSNSFIWYTRPGKESGVSASFNREKRCYYIFTSSTELEPSKGYNPSTLLAILKFAGDKKLTYRHLCDNGYGKVKQHIERKKVQSISRNPAAIIPANFSNEAKEIAQQLKQELSELHPFGMFWKPTDKGYIISREALITVSEQLGFRYHIGNVVRVDKLLIHKIEERDYQDILKGYIKEPEAEIYEEICNAFEGFMQRSGKYTMSRLPMLDDSKILRDTKDVSYKFFANGFLSIDAENITFSEYDSLSDVMIWADRCQDRNYNKGQGGKYMDFLSKATQPAHEQHVRRCIGYLAHEYKDETTGYIIVLTEQCQDPKSGGGSGKNVFCNLLSYSTTYTSKPGSQAKFDEKFFQSWNGQRIFGISDVPKSFDFSFLKEPSTGSFIWKKLFKDEIEVKTEDAPKFIVQTNYSYEVSDGGLRRRIIPIEFTNFFTDAGGLDVHYGVHFPQGWTNEDWAGFDNYVAESIQLWMQAGRKLSAPELTYTGWVKQFEQTYGQVAAGFIQEYWDEWVRKVNVSNDDFKNHLNAYLMENNIQRIYVPSMIKINKGVREWGDKHDIIVELDNVIRNNSILIRCKTFSKPAPF
jgi:hypothetical protein